MRLRAERPPDPALADRLGTHPMVELIPSASSDAGLVFWQGEWRRGIHVGCHADVRGLIELMDNNPMVCADAVSVPSPAGTLALIAFGPLVRANLLLETPVIRVNVAAEPEVVSDELGTAGWNDGVIVEAEEADLGGVVAAHGIAEITTPERWEEIDELYDEAFGRSLYVSLDDSSEWHVDLVRGRAHSVYRLTYSPGEGRSLLTIQVMADRDGKCGSAQIVHAMNVMAGFEESLGIA